MSMCFHLAKDILGETKTDVFNSVSKSKYQFFCILFKTEQFMKQIVYA